MIKSKKVDDLFDFYRKNKELELIIYGGGAGIYFWSTIIILLLIYFCLFMLLGSGNYIYCYLSLGLVVIGGITHISGVSKSNKYLKSNIKFAPYRRLINLKWWKYSYEEFVNEYQYTEIKGKLGGHTHMKSHIDDVISILEADGVRLFELNWKPVIILGAILFPSISEYIGFRYNLTLEIQSRTLKADTDMIELQKWFENTNIEGLALLVRLIPILIVVGLLVWFLVFLSEALLLTKVHDRRKLIKLLRLIKMDIKH